MEDVEGFNLRDGIEMEFVDIVAHVADEFAVGVSFLTVGFIKEFLDLIELNKLVGHEVW